ncbi:unnamed protein product [Mesocestoides corti]|uniref:Uncharacterized protein n=1 Tax=Mesocestoides corti TaxID=53468 RepID=A0A0R3UR40_MESCO|nr:unnamed protein product [Mesocestoides corti]
MELQVALECGIEEAHLAAESCQAKEPTRQEACLCAECKAQDERATSELLELEAINLDRLECLRRTEEERVIHKTFRGHHNED